MEKRNHGNFDVPVDGASDSFVTVRERLERFDMLVRTKNYESALTCILKAIETGNVSAKLTCARFLTDTPQLRMKQQERYALAERLLLEAENLLDLSGAEQMQIALDLARIYEYSRPVAYIACLLKAKRLGAAISDREIEDCRRKLNRLDINRLGEDPKAACRLGLELRRAGSAGRMAEIFLREAAGAENPAIAGNACLNLAEFYAENSANYPSHLPEARKYYRLAEEKGFPDLLVREPEENRTSRANAG